ncbi:MAG TPA: hypothetical protein PLO25_03655, partial [Candidatus Saccharibacteria bacterium]|nr:hypothetical protein [Candidatus Competibacteraceae bacterium]HPF31367.1 hypothetical protein [Candidatus Saccharibacteria bacterium]
GFKFDGKRRFTKADKNGRKQIIEYQVGTRTMQGWFAINLISGDRAIRLAMIRPTLISKFVNWLFRDYDPWWKGIFFQKMIGGESVHFRRKWIRSSIRPWLI